MQRAVTLLQEAVVGSAPAPSTTRPAPPAWSPSSNKAGPLDYSRLLMAGDGVDPEILRLAMESVAGGVDPGVEPFVWAQGEYTGPGNSSSTARPPRP